MNTKPIGIFDSGVGAFSVLNELVKMLPHEDYVYFGDSGHNPYGQKTTEELQSLCKSIVEFLLKKDVKTIVIACNTATEAALEYLQEKFDVDIIGVIEPGAQEALKVTKNGKIGVCATMFTAKTHAYKKQIEKLNRGQKDIKIYEEGHPTLASIVESGFERNEENEQIIKDFVQRLPEEVDTLILGCTHYPFLRDLFGKYFSGNIVDPGFQTALEVKEMLTRHNRLNNKKERGNIQYYVTKNPQDFKSIAQNLTELKIENIEQANID